MTRKSFVLGVSVCILFGLCSTAAANSCRVEITKQIPKNEPVYLLEKSDGHLSLFEPDGNSIEISSNDKLILYCPGRRNTLIHSNDNSAELACTSNFRSELHQLNCTKQIAGDLETTTKTCHLNTHQGLIYRAGFAFDRKFVETYEICYDSARASVLYTHHQINGKSINYNIKESDRRSFKANGIPKLAKVEVSYRKQTQINHFKSKLGTGQRYFTNSSFLSRGHLTPDADFVFSSAQFATYFFANVCPQFQSINGANWNRVENVARNLAEQEKTTLNIYTGVYGQLALASSSGDSVPLYLSETNQIEVPEYLWKIVHNSRTNAAIVFITSNNPFAKQSDVRHLCSDVCQEGGISFTQTARRGFTYCCTYEDFARRVAIQRPLTADRLLKLHSK
ncbi:uncharacterized protein LOC116342852 [Contarinia nasturtii]|uniref:uncharacterized protein LOC116342852 n=1 Tax=Contarinia nasturtii TaxID=265458 RepID=UPI0012D46C6C|nr:uncharacterized protein LOC116342852 [Contarinia nasturtii]